MAQLLGQGACIGQLVDLLSGWLGQFCGLPLICNSRGVELHLTQVIHTFATTFATTLYPIYGSNYDGTLSKHLSTFIPGCHHSNFSLKFGH